jgi:hypothetical protein
LDPVALRAAPLKKESQVAFKIERVTTIRQQLQVKNYGDQETALLIARDSTDEQLSGDPNVKVVSETKTVVAWPEADEPPTIKLDPRELGTMLAALRLWQAAGHRPLELEVIASDEGSFEPLDADEIDALAQRLNCGG